MHVLTDYLVSMRMICKQLDYLNRVPREVYSIRSRVSIRMLHALMHVD